MNRAALQSIVALCHPARKTILTGGRTELSSRHNSAIARRQSSGLQPIGLFRTGRAGLGSLPARPRSIPNHLPHCRSRLHEGLPRPENHRSANRSQAANLWWKCATEQSKSMVELGCSCRLKRLTAPCRCPAQPSLGPCSMYHRNRTIRHRTRTGQRPRITESSRQGQITWPACAC